MRGSPAQRSCVRSVTEREERKGGKAVAAGGRYAWPCLERLRALRPMVAGPGRRPSATPPWTDPDPCFDCLAPCSHFGGGRGGSSEDGVWSYCKRSSQDGEREREMNGGLLQGVERGWRVDGGSGGKDSAARDGYNVTAAARAVYTPPLARELLHLKPSSPVTPVTPLPTPLSRSTRSSKTAPAPRRPVGASPPE